MLPLSYGRLLSTRSVVTGLVTLAVLLSLVAPSAAGSTVEEAGGRRSRLTVVPHASYPEHHLASRLAVAQADTDTLLTTRAANQTSRQRGGYVVTEDQLDNEQDYPLSSVLTAHFPGIRVIHGSEMDRVANGLHMDIQGSPCFLQVFIDGVLIENGGVDWVSVRNLASIEYRTPGNVPVEFQNQLPGAMCGVLLLWSKYS
jgi:hypothetical protein